MRITGFFRQDLLQDNSDRKLPRKSSCLLILLLFFVSTTLASGPPNFAAANEKLQPTQLPVIVLPHSVGNFFVNITPSTGSDYILIPVALGVEEEFEKDLSQALRLEEKIPAQHIRLQPIWKRR